jgi:hypothetical protein
MSNLCEALEQLRQTMPPVFAGTALDELTGNAYRWRTLQNEKCMKKVREEVFLRSGPRKLLVVRDPFLDHWQAKIDGRK